jgi:hypothetical protein
MRKFLEKVSTNYQLQLHPTRDVQNSYNAYETSLETERLESENNRKIYCELIDLGRTKKLEKSVEAKPTTFNLIAADKPTVESNDSEEYVAVATADERKKWWTEISFQPVRTKTLADFAAKQLGEGYRKGEVDKRVQCQDAVVFGMNVDTELPILDLLELEVRLRQLLMVLNLNKSITR